VAAGEFAGSVMRQEPELRSSSEKVGRKEKRQKKDKQNKNKMLE
jgi:hypothetical protein